MCWHGMEPKDVVQKSLRNFGNRVRMEQRNKMCEHTELVDHHYDAIGVSKLRKAIVEIHRDYLPCFCRDG